MCHRFDLRTTGLIGVLSCVAAVSGCGSDAPDSPATVAQDAGTPAEQTSASPQPAPEPIPPVAAISPQQTAGREPAPAGQPADSESPDALLRQIADLVEEAAADVQQLQDDESAGAEDSPAVQAYRDHLEQVIDLATKVIALTHLDPEAEPAFNHAVQYLSEARLELATAGDAEQARLLLEDADSLYERDRESFAAAQAGFKVVELSERMARSLGGDDAEWLSEYAGQAHQFAERFPDQQARSAMALFTAGRLCDRYGLTDPARGCLERVQAQFGGTRFAEQSAGILRRLSLDGTPLELAGPTIDGGFVEIDHYKDHVVLVVFWATTSPTFLEQLPVLRQVESEFGEQKFAIIGVNLDQDEAAVDAFLSEHEIAWPQIFSADPDQREGRNPVARYYGVQILPTYWLVSPGGIVKATQINIDSLREAVASMLQNR